MSESINERIRAIREYYCNDSNIEFANRLGISRQAANNYARNGYIVGKSVIDNITDVFPDVNASWIITGEGYMLKSAEVQMIDRLMLLVHEIEIRTPFIDRLGYNKDELRVILEKDILTRNEIIGDLNEINPNININWILTGRGNMFKDSEERIPPGDLLQLYLKEKGVTKEEFADKMGISIEEADKHFNLKDGNMDYMHEWAKALGTKTTELFMSADTYLMYMEREGITSKGKEQNVNLFRNEVTPVSEGEYMMVEYVDLRASAGRLGGMPVDQLPETHKRLVPKEYAKGKYLVVGVDGDSMNDGTARSLSDGDEVLIYQHEGGIIDSLPIRKTLFVITTRDGNVLKQITEINRQEKYIICHSFNPAYEDFKIYFDDIYQVFIVCKIVQKQISLI